MKIKEQIKLKKIVEEFRGGLLDHRPSGSMCFMVSSALAGYLSFSGYDCKLTKGYVGECEHFWLTLPDGIIIDPTADQFPQPTGDDMPKVYIGEKPDWYRLVIG